jgi:hypothetical protein
MAIRFVEKPHSVRPGTTLIEVWDDDRFLAGIYAGSGRSVPDTRPIVRIISRHLDGIRPEGPDAEGVTALEVFFR